MLDPNKRYLVTGGTGFMGQALIDRLLRDGYLHIVAMARNEGLLRQLTSTRATVEAVMGDIADPCAVRRAASGCSGVFHLAAMKSVPNCEDYAELCARTNIDGSINLLRAAEGMDFFVGVSSDKAARVHGVYGASKLIMERLIANAAGANPFTIYRTVRFGNIFGSTGSVIPLWRRQLQAGKPITVTDRRAVRFFMPVEQAVDIILSCVDNRPDQPVSAPCVPVNLKGASVGDLLEAMVAKYAYDRPPVIVETGLGPGENLHEQLESGGPDSSQVPRYTVAELMEII